MVTDDEGQLSRAFEDTADIPENLDDLVERLVPVLRAKDLQRIEQIIHTAQRMTPRDPFEFVRKINRLFDVYCLRIRTEDGSFGRLRCYTGHSGIPVIKVTTTGRQAFVKGRLSIAYVPEDYARQRGPKSYPSQVPE